MPDKSAVLFVGHAFFNSGNQFFFHKLIKGIRVPKINLHILRDVCGYKISSSLFLPITNMRNGNDYITVGFGSGPGFLFAKYIIRNTERAIGHVNVMIFFRFGVTGRFTNGNNEFVFYLGGIDRINKGSLGKADRMNQ